MKYKIAVSLVGIVVMLNGNSTYTGAQIGYAFHLGDASKCKHVVVSDKSKTKQNWNDDKSWTVVCTPGPRNERTLLGNGATQNDGVSPEGKEDQN